MPTAKPVVSLVLPPLISAQMFREEDLNRLRELADVRGPFQADEALKLFDALQETVVVIAGWGSPKFDEHMMEGMPKLKLLAYSAGTVKPVVSDALFDCGVRVTTAALPNATPVAEFTVAMMIAMLKQVPWICAPFAAGDAAELQRRRALVRELQDMNVGLISASRVGREVIRLLAPYRGLTIKVYDPFLKPAAAAQLGVKLASLEEACACEVVSVHAPNIPQTHHMFNAKTLALLPDHAVFINTSRGALVDEAALVAEVRRRPLYVLLDVTDPEPPAADSPLRKEPNILLTPHIAGAIKQARRSMGANAIDQTIRFLKGEPLLDEVTREMLPTQA